MSRSTFNGLLTEAEAYLKGLGRYCEAAALGQELPHHSSENIARAHRLPVVEASVLAAEAHPGSAAGASAARCTESHRREVMTERENLLISCRTRASFQIGRFPPNEITGIVKDGALLVLTTTVRENGKPIWAVIALTLEGQTMKMAQMLEQSETIKRGSGTKE